MVLVAAAVLVALRPAFPERSLDAAGPRAIVDSAFAIGLAFLILFVARGLGWFLLRILGARDVDPLLGLVVAVGAGTGVLAYGVLALGLLGALQPATVFAWLLLATYLATRESVVHGTAWGDPTSAIRPMTIGRRLGLATGAAILVLSLVQALTPVWDHDGLMYHLQGPWLFLQAGRILLLPDLWQANGPLSTEMVYLIGLAGGSEVFSKVFHLTMSALLVLAAFAVARRHLGDRPGWLAAGLLVGVPIFPVWGSLAYADMAWAVFEFLAVASYLEWRVSAGRPWLVVSGMFLGWAMGSKYTGLALLPVLVAALLLDPIGGPFGRRVRSALGLGGVALLVASPWYLKNLSWTGNPIFPFLFGGPGWPAARLQLLMTYLQSFGTGRSVLDYLLLPISLLTRRAAFGTFMSRIDIPNPLFLLALAFPFLPRHHPFRPLGWIALLRFAFWAAGTQQTRFLLPLYPVLSLMGAGVLEAWIAHPAARVWRRLAATGLVAGMVGVTLAYQFIYMAAQRPLPVVFGTESKAAFLDRTLYDFAATRFIRASLEEDDRVLMAWDGRGYYCGERCLPDADQSQWTQLVQEHRSVDGLAAALRRAGVTHLLVDREGMDFLLLHDPSGAHFEAASMLVGPFASACLEPMFSSGRTTVYRLLCE